jgi:hypothetical protein
MKRTITDSAHAQYLMENEGIKTFVMEQCNYPKGRSSVAFFSDSNPEKFIESYLYRVAIFRITKTTTPLQTRLNNRGINAISVAAVMSAGSLWH